jgi:hypothetical protein
MGLLPIDIGFLCVGYAGYRVTWAQGGIAQVLNGLPVAIQVRSFLENLIRGKAFYEND